MANGCHGGAMLLLPGEVEIIAELAQIGFHFDQWQPHLGSGFAHFAQNQVAQRFTLQGQVEARNKNEVGNLLAVFL